MFNAKARRGRPDAFVSAKARSPIPARHPALRKAFVQAKLDPAVRSFAFLPSAHVAAAPVEVEFDAVVVTRDDGRFFLDVVPARPVRDLDDEGPALIALRELGLHPFVVAAEDVKAEPRCGNCRLVWSHHRRFALPPLRTRIRQPLRDGGPMELGRLPEGDRVHRDPTPLVLSLACDELLELHMTSRPLTPASMVRSRT
jgi:hypothetical protein